MMLPGFAFIWGLSEATLFFLVPDVILGWVILFERRNVIRCYGLALVGACVGGAIMYYWGANDLPGLQRILDRVPAISMDMINQTAYAMEESSIAAMMKGSVTGVPYKIFAANASSANLSVGVFLLLSVPARLARWILFGLITWSSQKTFLQSLSTNNLKITYLSFWLLFYIFFFYFRS